jgi:DnaJ-class molecular chaperone
MVKDTKLYDILELQPDASDEQIKKAYVKMSKIWHPDKHIEPDKKQEATLKFQEINQAKNILMDNEKRKIYDQVGMDMFKHNSDGNDPQTENPFNNFSNMFGGFSFNAMFKNNNKKQTIDNIIEKIDATLEQIVNKQSINLNYKQKISCNKCNGEGTKDGTVSECKICNGKGHVIQVVRMGPMIQQIVGECRNCNGKGTFIPDNNKCDTCSSKGFIIKDKTIMVPLSFDVLYGNDAVFEGKGHQIKNLKTNLIVKVNVLPHKIFKRYGEDLYIELELKLYQALFGFNKVITHLDGRKLQVTHTGKTDFNMIRKIDNEGLPNQEGKKGDLYIKFIVSLPNIDNLSNDTKSQFKGILQSLDKSEVLNETSILKNQNLIKTTHTDLKSEHCEKVLFLIDNIKHQKNTQQNHPENDDNEPSQCVHQ